MNNTMDDIVAAFHNLINRRATCQLNMENVQNQLNKQFVNWTEYQTCHIDTYFQIVGEHAFVECVADEKLIHVL